MQRLRCVPRHSILEIAGRTDGYEDFSTAVRAAASANCLESEWVRLKSLPWLARDNARLWSACYEPLLGVAQVQTLRLSGAEARAAFEFFLHSFQQPGSCFHSSLPSGHQVDHEQVQVSLYLMVLPTQSALASRPVLSMMTVKAATMGEVARAGMQGLNGERRSDVPIYYIPMIDQFSKNPSRCTVPVLST